MAETTQVSSDPRLPRVTIQFCTQCKWMLRAAYYAQELLSTFSLSLGEVALQPATGGVFVVEITTTTATTTPEPEGTTAAASTSTSTPAAHQTKAVLWDRKIDGGFPEVKELKRRVRDVIQPDRDLGHVDRDYGRQGKGGDGDVKARTEGGGEASGVKKGEGAGEAGGEAVKGKVCGVEGGEKCEDCQ